MSHISTFLVQIEDYLAKVVNQETSLLAQAISYVTLSGGKRIRPLLVIAGGQLNSANHESLIKIGCALELIHCYSLVHDDLPAMDNDDLRRGVPTCHIKYNEAVAILTGDALQALAFELLSSENIGIKSNHQIKIIELIAKASGVSGMVGGQALDLQATGNLLTINDLEQMHKMKTGALIRTAILSGYLAGTNFDSNKYYELIKIADKIGLLFQIVDDILDITEDSTTLGKTANKDLINNKATYVSMLGLEAAKSKADELYQNILKDLEIFDEAQLLKDLTTMMYKRNK